MNNPTSFDPVVGVRPRALILGSVPGVASLRLRQYYGHPQNGFWKIMGEILGEDLRGMTYARRLKALKRRRVALWDAIARCRRKGSLDSAIVAEQPNAVLALLRNSPSVGAVFFNGRKAQSAFLRRCVNGAGLPSGVDFHCLPSTSPANASIRYADKLRRWRRIADYLPA